MKTLCSGRLFAAALCLALAPGLAAEAAAGPEPLPRKLIVTGWDNPDTAQFRRDLRSMEKWPFDGAVIYAQGRNSDGKLFDARAAFDTNNWEPDCFTNALADLQAARSDKLTDNFLIFGANPGNVDWFDDAGWQVILHHCRLLAWLARQGGLKGLLFDPEPYTDPFKQFKYSAQPGRAAHSFDDYCAKAHRRGCEMMNAIKGEFPDIVLYTYFLLSECSRAVSGGANPQPMLEGHSYGLLPAFADGMLDWLPPTATLIDGNEGAYRYNSEAAFNAAFVRIKNGCQALVSPGNRPKYRAQVQVSHGIYLDAYINPPSSSYYIDGLGGPRVDRLERNVAAAFNAADRYVWIYGEHARWWPPRHSESKVPPTWPEVLPGADTALLKAKDPAQGSRPTPKTPSPAAK